MSFTANIEEVVTENLNGLLSKHTTWCRVPLGQVAEVLNGFPFDSKRFVQVRAAPLIRIRDIVRGRTETFYDGEIPDGYWVEAGEILIGMDGDFNIARWKSERALLNQRVLKLSAKSSFYNERFLFFVVAGYLQAINEKTPSVTVKHLSSKTVLSIPLPLPPLAEQTRIAAKLDELLAQVDTLKARIDAIPALLKRFRQSVLAAAVSGRLTEEWRASNPNMPALSMEELELGIKSSGFRPKAKGIGAVQVSKIPGWLDTPLGAVLSVRSGDGLTAKEMNEGGTIPVYGGNGINGYHTEGNVTNRTVVIGRVGYYCGSVHFTPNKAWVTDNALVVNYPNTLFDINYIYWLLLGTNLRENTSSSAQPVISGEKIYPIKDALK